MYRTILTGVAALIYSLIIVQFAFASSNPQNTTSQTKSLPYFHTIALSGVGNLYITQSDEQSLVVKAEPALLQLVKAFVKEGTLFLDLQNASKLERAEINYYLTVRDIKHIQSFSSANIFIERPFKTNELTLSIKSFGEMNVNLNVSTLLVDIQGAGKIKARGIAHQQAIAIDGAGEFIGNMLKGEKAEVGIVGAGLAKMHASERLLIQISEEGTVGYCGEPSISKTITKNGIVEPLVANQCP